MPDIAIIGGTGLTRLAGLEIARREVVYTPYGEPSGPLTHGVLAGRKAVFVARHGYGHTIAPHKVNYRANLWALKSIGVERVVAVASVGAIRSDLTPGALAIPHQIVDYTTQRENTFFDEQKVIHVDFTEPYDPVLRALLLQAADAVNLSVARDGVYGASQGPRLETAAEIDRMGINVWEVIDAAATKPFGFMPFYPGPGLGGHCIPIDPFYLSWKTRQAGIEARFIELAGYINGQMPMFVVEKVQNALNDVSKPVRGSHIHILGVAYKRDIDDLRESPALDVMHLLKKRGAHITFSDPYVAKFHLDGKTFLNQDLLPAIRQADCVVIITDHSKVDYAAVVEHARLIVDTRNALRSFDSPKIVKL
jgi:purine nucleoside phosphorylase